MSRLWKIVKGVGENLPLFLAFGAAFYTGYVLDDREGMHFFIIMAAFFFLLRDQAEIRARLKALSEDNSSGRHH